jgi:alpha-glucan, water dikinase
MDGNQKGDVADTRIHYRPYSEISETEKSRLAYCQVWASKWNERAYFSTRKVKLDHANLCMSVLVQEVVSADYAFVIHTTNPSSGESSEIYAEVVKGLGETLVGAYPGRAMSFVCKKDNLDSPRVNQYY